MEGRLNSTIKSSERVLSAAIYIIPHRKLVAHGPFHRVQLVKSSLPLQGPFSPLINYQGLAHDIDDTRISAT